MLQNVIPNHTPQETVDESLKQVQEQVKITTEKLVAAREFPTMLLPLQNKPGFDAKHVGMLVQQLINHLVFLDTKQKEIVHRYTVMRSAPLSEEENEMQKFLPTQWFKSMEIFEEFQAWHRMYDEMVVPLLMKLGNIANAFLKPNQRTLIRGV